jgi:uncharacterized membrane protein YphA (DoxX/SURF4 family)
MSSLAIPAPRRPPWVLWTSTLARLALAGVFFVSGGLKVADPGQSVRAVQAYEILPHGAARVVGYGLPFLEIALALLLLFGLATRLAAAASIVLLLIFVGGVSSAWARGLSIDCGCFGGGGSVNPNQTRYLQEILRDTGFILLAGWLVLRPQSRLAIDPHHHPDLHLHHDDVHDDDLHDDDPSDEDVHDRSESNTS